MNPMPASNEQRGRMKRASQSLAESGFVTWDGLLSDDELSECQREWTVALAKASGRAGHRIDPQDHPVYWSLAHGRLRELAEGLLARECRIIKLTAFDKSSAANWSVALHQDLMVTIADRCDHPGWGPWSKRADHWQVRPPLQVLESMVALRLSLDDSDAERGGLSVVPGSHREGDLSPERSRALRDQWGQVTPGVRAGSVLAMNPLCLHSSSVAKNPSHRRVLHFEFASTELPSPLRWAMTDE